jgi:hypothetical protein
MVRRILVGMTTHKGRVNNPEYLKVLTNETPIYIAIEAVLQTPKQAERVSFPTFPDATSCLTHVLEGDPDTLVARMDSSLFNDS